MDDDTIVPALKFSFGEQLEQAINLHDGWDNYKTNYFIKLDPQARTLELAHFQRKMSEEARATREWGRLLRKKARAGRSASPAFQEWPMNLAETIQTVQVKNEKAIAARFAAPPELDAEAQIRLAPFITFCKERGIRYLPASPAGIALFITTQHEAGVSGKTRYQLGESGCHGSRSPRTWKGIGITWATNVVQA